MWPQALRRRTAEGGTLEGRSPHAIEMHVQCAGPLSGRAALQRDPLVPRVLRCTLLARLHQGCFSVYL